MQKTLFDVEQSEETRKYTKKVLAPQYVPNNKKPRLEELYDYSKCSSLIKAIKDSNVSDEDKEFLLKAATRHIVFNYDKIADYYAHSDKEMQELMEQSALVIIDFDDALANGYIKLSKTIEDIVKESNNG